MTQDLGGDRSAVAGNAESRPTAGEGRESLSAAPGAEAERLAGHALEREIRAGVEHFKTGQHHATIEGRDLQDFFDPITTGDVGRVTYVDVGGALCVVLTWRDTGSDEWRPTWISRTGMYWKEDAVRAPEGFSLSEKMLDALDEADARGVPSQRVRMDLAGDAHMDVNVSPDVSPETLAALRSVGEAAAERLRNEDDAALRNYLAKPKGIDE